MKKQIICANCGNPALIEAGHITRSRQQGMYLYCSRVCSGLGRRKGKTKAELVADKAAYDREYRAKNAERRKRQNHEWFKKTYDPAKARIVRKANMGRHLEYCRRPEYKAWKAAYDKRYLASKEYADFAEAALLLRDLENEILSRATRYEIGYANGTVCKSQNRRREYARLISSEP